MTASLFSAAASLLGLVAVSAVTLLTALILRNPLASNWLRSEAVAHGASLILTAGVLVAVVYAAAGLAAANIHYGIAVVVVAGVLAGSAYFFWKVFNLRDRLERADAGQSPFARRKQASATSAVALHPTPTDS